MQKLKVTAVSYLNTKPFLYGIFNNKLEEQIDLQLDIPSVCAQKLQDGEADLGLVPVASIPHIKTPYIMSDFCIGSVGKVKTVCIFSNVPIEDVTHIYLDFHSRTSVELAKILMEEYWKVQPIILPANKGFENKIKETTAALIIGDRAMGLDKEYAHCYDLGEAWEQHTGLPFVFAAWVSNRPLNPSFIKTLNEALAKGIESIPQLIYLIPPPESGFDLKEYFTKNISYQLDDKKKEALSLFLEKIKTRSFKLANM